MNEFRALMLGGLESVVSCESFYLLIKLSFITFYRQVRISLNVTKIENWKFTVVWIFNVDQLN